MNIHQNIFALTYDRSVFERYPYIGRWSFSTINKEGLSIAHPDGRTPNASLVKKIAAKSTSLLEERAALVFAAELENRRIRVIPESLIAQLWNEFLGPRPIPFDVEARKQMIEEARAKPEMRKHIDQWIALKEIWDKTGERPW